MFAAVAVVVCLAGLEGLLALAGVKPASASRDPYAGFTPTVPHFVVERGAGGVERVSVAPAKRDVLNPITFEARKPAGTYRIVCLGGSTTYGRPFFDMTSFPGWLRAFLPVADASRRWEVINAGAISYASYRVAGLMDELARFEPDLVVVYAGHNEFLERRTYADVLKTPGPLRDAAGLVSRTRIGGVVQGALERAGVLGAAGARVVTAKVGDEVARIPINAVGPEAYRRDDVFRAEVLAHFRASLERIVATARRTGARVVFVTPVSNLRDLTPFKSENRANLTPPERESWQARFRRGVELQAAGDAAGAVTAFEAARSIDGRHAGLLYRLARATADVGDLEGARRLYALARDEDVVPLRALSETVAIVRGMARREGVDVVDFEAELGASAERGAPGVESFCDHVHMTSEAYRGLALRLVAWMSEEGIARPSAAWGEGAIEAVTREVEAKVDRRLHARELRTLSEAMERLNQMTMAVVCARRAVALTPEDGAAWAALGARALRAGRGAEASEAYREALDRAPDDLGSRDGLGAALLLEGKAAEALPCFELVLRAAPRAAAVHARRGRALEMLGRREDAAAAFRTALELEPAQVEARDGLARVDAR